MASNNLKKARNQLHEHAMRGENSTQEEIDAMTKQETDLFGKGDTSAEQGGADVDRCRWTNKADDILSKPANEINTEEARELQQEEAHAFGRLPPAGSLASHVQSVADSNANTEEMQHVYKQGQPPPRRIL